MLKVRVKSGELAAQLIHLKAGSNRFGRSSENDFQIEHSSVSSNHCEIILEKDLVRIHDFGSTNGTFIDGKRISTATLNPGQSFRIGVVELILEAGGLNAADTNAASLCAQHPRMRATAECAHCKKTFCDHCVTTRVVEGVMKKFCRKCGRECDLVNIDAVAHQTDDARSFALLTNALGYPLQRHGWVLLLSGSLLFFVIDIATAGFSMGSPATAAFALVFAMLAAGYLFAFLQRIITTTTLGEDKMPGWPDFTEVWQDMIQPFRLLWGLFAACFGPAIVCWYFVHNGSDLAEKLFWPLIIAGFLYLPMALLGVAMSDSLSSLNPIFVVASICKVPAQYIIACLLLALIVGLKWAIEVALAKIIPLIFIRYLISSVLLLYFFIVEMRVLGLMYLWNRRKLGWM